MIYIYDGTFNGLLTAIYISAYDRTTPYSIQSCKYYQDSLVEEKIIVETDLTKSGKVKNAIYSKLSSECFNLVHTVFLSEESGSEMLIWYFLKLGFKIGPQIENHLTDSKILSFIKLAKKVRLEVHRLYGLIRFNKLENNLFYSTITPDHNVLSLLTHHFSNRFADQNWIIHDIKREKALIFNTKKSLIISLKPNEIYEVENSEFNYQSLWKTYFKSIAIKERKNLRLQKQYMPKRYWKHLTEKQ